MKFLLIIFLVLPLASQCQNDFDYRFYTSRCDIFGKKDSLLNLLLPRCINKTGEKIQLINLTNTGDSHTYSVSYLGWQGAAENLLFIYQSDSGSYIFCNPVYGKLEIIDKLKRTTYH